MGWSIGEACERAVGYGITAVCDEPSCTTVIDRGLSYACNDQHGCDADDECNGYFCTAHKYIHDCSQHYAAAAVTGQDHGQEIQGHAS